MEFSKLKKNKIYVLQLGMTKNIGGMETYLMAQYRNLDKNIIQYDFVNLTEEYPIAFEKEIKDNGSRIYSVPTRRINPILHYYKIMKILLKKRKMYDYIILNTCHLYYIFPLFIAKMVGIPNRIIHSHNSKDEIKLSPFRRMWIKFNKQLMNFSVTGYWACSNIAGKWMFGDKSFRIIHNAIKGSEFIYDEKIRQKVRYELGISENKFIVGHVGKFSYQKNHDFLIEIFSEIHEILPESELLLIGGTVNDKTYLDNAKEKVRKLNLDNNVKFLGLRKDVSKLMQAMDCFVLPSHFEGLPLVGIEAQASGLPCYFSDNITKEVKVTNLVEFISLEKSSKYWANKIIKSKNLKRINMLKDIVQAGYDINKEIKRIEDFYLKNVNGEV